MNFGSEPMSVNRRLLFRLESSMKTSAYPLKTGFSAAVVLGFAMSVPMALEARVHGKRKSQGQSAVDSVACAFPFRFDQPNELGIADLAGNREDTFRLAVKLLVSWKFSGDRTPIQTNRVANQN